MRSSSPRSSAIVASRFTEGLKGRARCLVAHPVNPPHVVPIVELCAGALDRPRSRRAGARRSTRGRPGADRAEEGDRRLRPQPAAGRAAGRGLPAGRRGLSLSAEDLDKTIAHGLGLRWSFMGPFETIELNAPGGIPDYCARYWSLTHGRSLAGATLSAPRRVETARTWQARAWQSWARRRPSRRGEIASARATGATERLAALAARTSAREAIRSLTRPLDEPTPEMAKTMAKARKVIITCAVTGSIHTPSMSPHLPITAEEIADAADRRGRGRRRDRPPARARSRGRPARPVAGGLRAVPEGHQAALRLRHQHHHRRRADHDDRGARCSPARDLQARGRLAQHGLDELRPLPDARALQGVQARLGEALSRRLARPASSRTPSRTSSTS